jgi:hypothetical protein
MASNRGHLDPYRSSNLLFGIYLILNHNFVRFFGSLADLLMEALDGRRADLARFTVSPTEATSDGSIRLAGSSISMRSASIPMSAPPCCHDTPS